MSCEATGTSAKAIRVSVIISALLIIVALGLKYLLHCSQIQEIKNQFEMNFGVPWPSAADRSKVRGQVVAVLFSNHQARYRVQQDDRDWRRRIAKMPRAGVEEIIAIAQETVRYREQDRERQRENRRWESLCASALAADFKTEAWLCGCETPYPLP